MNLGELAEKLRLEKELTLRVKAIPKSPRNEIAGVLADGTLKIRIQAAPERGKANAELCSFLAKELNVNRGQVTIVSGASSPRKLIRISL